MSLFGRLNPFHTDTARRDDALAVLRQHHTHVVFKHSPSCGLSGMAYAEVRRYLERPDALPVTVVDVRSQRSLSLAIAESTQVDHESPQVLLVRNGVVEWHASHRGVTADALARSAREARSDTGPSAA